MSFSSFPSSPSSFSSYFPNEGSLGEKRFFEPLDSHEDSRQKKIKLEESSESNADSLFYSLGELFEELIGEKWEEDFSLSLPHRLHRFVDKIEARWQGGSFLEELQKRGMLTREKACDGSLYWVCHFGIPQESGAPLDMEGPLWVWVTFSVSQVSFESSILQQTAFSFPLREQNQNLFELWEGFEKEPEEKNLVVSQFQDGSWSELVKVAGFNDTVSKKEARIKGTGWLALFRLIALGSRMLLCDQAHVGGTGMSAARLLGGKKTWYQQYLKVEPASALHLPNFEGGSLSSHPALLQQAVEWLQVQKVHEVAKSVFLRMGMRPQKKLWQIVEGLSEVKRGQLEATGVTLKTLFGELLEKRQFKDLEVAYKLLLGSFPKGRKKELTERQRHYIQALSILRENSLYMSEKEGEPRKMPSLSLASFQKDSAKYLDFSSMMESFSSVPASLRELG